MKKEDDICKYCDGTGKQNISDCCGAAPRGNGDCDTSDIGICSDCGEYCEYGVECDMCGGLGYIEASEQELQEELERADENIKWDRENKS